MYIKTGPQNKMCFLAPDKTLLPVKSIDILHISPQKTYVMDTH